MQAAGIWLVLAYILQNNAVTTARTQSVFAGTVQERALLGQAPLFWSSLAPQSAAASTSAAAGAAQGAGSSQQLLLAAPEQVAGGDMAAVGTAQACSLPSSHRLQAEAGADGGASHALLAASQAFYQVCGGIKADRDHSPVIIPQTPPRCWLGHCPLSINLQSHRSVLCKHA